MVVGQLKGGLNIVLLGLFPVLVAICVYGKSFKSQRLLLHSHKKGVVFTKNCLLSKSDPVVTILRH